MKTFKNFQELVTEKVEGKPAHEIPPNSDLFKFTQLYESFGIECKIRHSKKYGYRIKLSGQFGDSRTISDKLKGYGSLYSKIYFETNGKFVEQGFWE